MGPASEQGPGETALPVSGEARAYFHSCPPDPACPYCTGDKAAQRYDWSFAGQAYCISLQSREDRTRDAAAHFHAMGLCQQVTFYRPLRHPTRVVAGIWESHRAVAMAGLAAGHDRILVFEDDVRFMRRATPAAVARAARELSCLPAGWELFFLGHWPFRARFVSPHTLAVSSACAHAYFASRPLMEWLAAHDFNARRHLPRRRIAGKGIDAYLAMRPGAFALWPMIALQSGSASDHFAHSRAKRSWKPHHLMVRPAWFESFFARVPLLFEALTVAAAVPRALLAHLRGS